MGNVKRHVSLAASNEDTREAGYLDRTLSWSEGLRLAREARAVTLGDAPERRVLPVRKPWEREAEPEEQGTAQNDPVELARLITLNAENPEQARKTVRERRAELISQFAARSDPATYDAEPETDQTGPVGTVLDPVSDRKASAAQARPITKPLSTGFAAAQGTPRRRWPIFAALVLALAMLGAGAIVVLTRAEPGMAPSSDETSAVRPVVPAVVARAPQPSSAMLAPDDVQAGPDAPIASSAGPVRRVPALLPEDPALIDERVPTRSTRVAMPVSLTSPGLVPIAPSIASQQAWIAEDTAHSAFYATAPGEMHLPSSDQMPICLGCDASGLTGLAGLDVVVHTAHLNAPNGEALRAALALAGANSLRERYAPIAASQGQVRYYDAAQADTARQVAGMFGGTVVDLTWYRPQPETPRLDIFLPGGA